MRDIKFRAWDNGNKRYYKPTYEAYQGKLEYLSISMLSGSLMMTTIKGQIDESLFPNRFILEQYTGLKDKNGKEIYEGDIVSFNEWIADNPEIMKSAPVVWYQEKCCFIPQSVEENHKGGHFIHHWDFIGSITVIGNIHENPELLK